MENKKVYVLKEYDDELAYGEEKLSVFESYDDAVDQLKTDVESFAGCSWDSALNTLLSEFDDVTYEQDYVSCANSDHACFFIVEEHKLVPAETDRMYDVTFHAFLPAEGNDADENLDYLYSTLADYITSDDYAGACEISADAACDGKWYADLWVTVCVHAKDEKSAREKAQPMVSKIFTDRVYHPDIAEINEYKGN